MSLSWLRSLKTSTSTRRRRTLRLCIAALCAGLGVACASVAHSQCLTGCMMLNVLGWYDGATPPVVTFNQYQITVAEPDVLACGPLGGNPNMGQTTSVRSCSSGSWVCVPFQSYQEAQASGVQDNTCTPFTQTYQPTTCFNGS